MAVVNIFHCFLLKQVEWVISLIDDPHKNIQQWKCDKIKVLYSVRGTD